MGVFSRGVPINQFQVLFTSCIDICLQVLQVGTRCHLFTSWYMLSLCGHLFTSWYTWSFVYKLLQGVTMSFKFMYHHIRKSRSEMT